MMKIAILGLGYVGLTGAGCLVKQGHSVIGIEPNEEKIKILMSGRSPIFEPGLDALLSEGIAKNILNATTRVDNQLEGCDIAMVCVGTPSAADGSHNMSYIAEVSRQIAQELKGKIRAKPLCVLYRSTMRPGSIDTMIMPIFKSMLGDSLNSLVELVYNPEFLRESVAITDYFNPPKIVVGTKDGLPSEMITELYSGIVAPVFNTRFREAELTKFVDNTWHAVKVAYANEIGRVCLQLGIDTKKIHEIFISDTKLNISSYYTRPGGAFGGSCLPKDVRALSFISEEVGAYNHLVDSLMRSNEAHKRFLFQHVTKDIPKGAKVLLIGLAFKADSDDLRESPKVDMARRLIQAGYDLKIYDPTVNPSSLIGQNLGYTYANLPSISDLLLEREDVDKYEYDLVIDTFGTAHNMVLKSTLIVNINSL
jgi:GDP-mannose 6-dehydrogenase